MIISDMKAKMDPTQYGNQKQTSIQHYLIKIMNRIVTSVDNNSREEVNAVLALFVYWKSLGVKSFIKNGVRLALIPLLVNYFQTRIMRVKHHNKTSAPRSQPG